jgi:hypothetical protein
MTMKQPASTLLSIFWLATATLSFSQNPAARQPCPDVTADALGCELIAWSQLQAPVPLPDADHQADQQLEQARPEAAPAPESNARHDQLLQTVTGVVVRNDGRYSLQRRPEATLLLLCDDPRRLQYYEGRQVQINGRVDAELQTLQVAGVAPVP